MKNDLLLLPPSSVQVSSMSSYIEISIDRDITAPSDFREEISAIRAAKESDVIHICITTDGGRLDTAHAIISAMRQSPAHIICEAVGTVASAGTIIFLSGDEFRVNPHVEFMVHTSSSTYGGKTNNLSEYITHQQKSIRSLVEDCYKHFLSDDEIESVLSGTDYWMDSDEVVKRLEDRTTAMKINSEEITREELESWPHERLVSFIYDESYLDGDWEGTDKEWKPTKVTLSIDDIETTQDILILKAAADSFDIKYQHNIKLETLRNKILKFLED
jgi:ATP-dependent protease ClpP protease subunit